MITVYKFVVYSKNVLFLKCILFTHRNDYCIQMLLSEKTEIASPEKLSGHNQSRFRILEYDRIPAPDSIFYSELHRYVVTRRRRSPHAANTCYPSHPAISVIWSVSLSLQPVPMFWCCLVGADRPPKQAMSVARQKDLGLCVLWLLSLSLQSVPVALYV